MESLKQENHLNGGFELLSRNHGQVFGTWEVVIAISSGTPTSEDAGFSRSPVSTQDLSRM